MARAATAVSMRALWRRVHPDLFQLHPVAAEANQLAMQELGTFLDAAAERQEALREGLAGPSPPPRLLTFFVDAPAPREVRVRVAPPRVPRNLSPLLAAEHWEEGMERLIADAVATLDGISPDTVNLGDAAASERRANDYGGGSPLYTAARSSPDTRAGARSERPRAARSAPTLRVSLWTKRLFFGGLSPEEEASVIGRLGTLLPQIDPSLVAELAGRDGAGLGCGVTSSGPPKNPVHPPIVVTRAVGEPQTGVAQLGLHFGRAELEKALWLALGRQAQPQGSEARVGGGSSSPNRTRYSITYPLQDIISLEAFL